MYLYVIHLISYIIYHMISDADHDDEEQGRVPICHTSYILYLISYTGLHGFPEEDAEPEAGSGGQADPPGELLDSHPVCPHIIFDSVCMCECVCVCVCVCV